MKKGVLIAIEGIDGAGKNTLGYFIKTLLSSNVVILTYPDYSSIWGHIIKDYLNNKIELDTNEQFFTYFIDILKNQTEIRDLLEKGNNVIVDRYFFSTIAFQCTKGFNYQKALSILKLMEAIEPELTLFIHIPAYISLKRKYHQNKYLDRHEKDIELLDNVNNMYEKMLKENVLSKKWVKIDGTLELDEVKRNVKTEIEKL